MGGGDELGMRYQYCTSSNIHHPTSYNRFRGKRKTFLLFSPPPSGNWGKNGTFLNVWNYSLYLMTYDIINCKVVLTRKSACYKPLTRKHWTSKQLKNNDLLFREFSILDSFVQFSGVKRVCGNTKKQVALNNTLFSFCKNYRTLLVHSVYWIFLLF